jgi:hypothetical protein
MKRRLAILIISLALAGCGLSPRCATDDAQGLVEALRAKQQLRLLLKMTVEQTLTSRMIAKGDGADGRQKLAGAIDAAVERHAAKWERNMAAGWQTLGAADIRQACAALENRDQEAFRRFTKRAGPEVQLRSEPVLRRAAVEVISAVW